MKKIWVPLLCVCFLPSAVFSFTPDKTLVSARESLLSSSAAPAAVLLRYSDAAKKNIAAPVAAEYAYALAYAGVADGALYNLDRALITEPLNVEVRFYASEILNAFGLAAASDEIPAPVPAWLKRPVKLPSLDLPAPGGDFEAALAVLNVLMSQKRYAQSAVQFDRLCKSVPANARCYAGYAISLEKLGCYKAAAAQAKKNLELSVSPERKAAAQAYIASLEARPPLKYGAPAGNPLKGRYLAFLGGSLNHTGGESIYSFNTRAGRFVSERLDIFANAGLSGGNPLSDYNGLTLGAGARYNEPLGFAPLNGTLAAKIERIPAPDKNLTLVVSPGLSYFLPDSSIDLSWDVALAGRYSGSVTMSLGYTVYFGGPK